MRGLQDFRFCSLIERLTALQRLTPAAATGHRGALAAQVGLAAKLGFGRFGIGFGLTVGPLPPTLS